MKSLRYAFIFSILFGMTLCCTTASAQEISHWIEVDQSEWRLKSFVEDSKGRIYSIMNRHSDILNPPKEQFFRTFDPTGKLIIERPIDDQKHILGIESDKEGNVIFTGMLISSSGEKKAFIEKQTFEGRPLWQKSWFGPGGEAISAIRLLKNDDLLVIGVFGMAFFDKEAKKHSGTFEVKIGNEKIAFETQRRGEKCIIRLDKNGNVKWAKRLSIPVDDWGQVAFCIGHNNETYIYGSLGSARLFNSAYADRFPDSNLKVSIGDYTANFQSICDHFVFKLSPKGEVKIAHIFPFSDFPFSLEEFAVDSKGNLIFGGEYNLVRRKGNIVSSAFPAGYPRGITLLKLSSSGELIWQKAFASGESASLNSMTVGPSDMIYFSTYLNQAFQYGCSYRRSRDTSKVYWDGQILEEIVGAQTYLSGYDQEGNLIWKENPQKLGSFEFLASKNHLWATLETRSKKQLMGLTFGNPHRRFGTKYLIKFQTDGENASSNYASAKPKNVTVFPNTSPDRFQLSLGPAFSGEVKLSVADASGRTILKRTLHKEEDLLQTEIDLGRFAEGAYVLHLSDGWETASKKLVVKK